MTKQYPIISLNREMYMVDNETPKHWYIDDTNAIRPSVTNDPDYWSRRKDYKNIVAATDKKLGLPLLPSIEEEIKLYEDIEDPQHPVRGVAERYYKAGYKAASKKQYTEEDMRLAWHQGIINQMRYEDSEPCINIDQFLATLKPIPTAVEVEMECKYEPKEKSKSLVHIHGSCCIWIPKVDKQGFIIFKRWIYEKET